MDELERLEKTIKEKVDEINTLTTKWCKYVNAYGQCAYSNSGLDSIVKATSELKDLTNEYKERLEKF